MQFHIRLLVKILQGHHQGVIPHIHVIFSFFYSNLLQGSSMPSPQLQLSYVPNLIPHKIISFFKQSKLADRFLSQESLQTNFQIIAIDEASFASQKGVNLKPPALHSHRKIFQDPTRSSLVIVRSFLAVLIRKINREYKA